MPASFWKPKPFALTALDKQVFDPETGAQNDISLWAKLYFDIDVFPWQHYFYHYPCNDKMAVAGIRTGKSFGASLFFPHLAQFNPNTQWLNTSISSEQAKIVFNNILNLVKQDRYKHWIETVEKSPYPLIRWINGSEIWFRSIGHDAELIRGFEFDGINIDEAGYVTSKYAIDTLRGRLLGFNPRTQKPRMGLFWQMTSPKGKVGPTYERWKKGDPRFPGADPKQYLSLRILTSDNPTLSPAILAEIMAEYSEKMIRQEFLGEFLDDEGAEFDIEQLMWCCDDVAHHEVAMILNQIEEWREKKQKKSSLRATLGVAEEIEYYELEPQHGHQYITSWDLGKKPTKSGRNATVGMVWDITELPWRMVGYRYEQGSSYLAAMGWIEQWHTKYSQSGNVCQTIIDASGKGDVLNELIEAENRIQVDGIVYSNQLKPNLITSGKIAIERDMVRFPFIRRMVDQLSTYTQNDADLAQDIVMCFCQAMHKAREFTGISTTRPSVLTARAYRRGGPMTPLGVTQRFNDRRASSFRLRTGHR